ncbi:MAG: acyl-CoA dehydrogenase family protein [Burkholderiales bacterium]|nr:acyl-CoA dehydrogenase family protein [Burkholderiales bacterium]
MDFGLSDEQQMLQDATRRFLLKEYPFDTRRRDASLPAEELNRTIWHGFAELGLLALLVPEEQGGLNGNSIDTMLVMAEMGRALTLEPYLSSAILSTKLIALLGTTSQRDYFLAPLATGERSIGIAHEEISSRFDRMAIQTTASQQGEGYVLNGHKSVVPHAASADYLLITARCTDSKLGVFAVPRAAQGLRLVTYKTVDSTPASEVWLQQLAVPASARLGDASGRGDATAALEQVMDIGLAAICAEAVGAMDSLLAATVDYVKNRRQFGVAIGRFQALQHRMAEMVLQIEQARSMSFLAAMRCEESDAVQRHAAMSAAKVVIGQACRFVGQQAVQLHGGMGVSDELGVSHYFKRLMAIELQFGNTEQHLEYYADQLM